MRIAQINNQNISHKAVNQKYFQKAKETYERCKPHHNQGHLLTMLDLEVAYGRMSFQDGIDTLEAIKPYAQNALECINDSIESFKYEIKMQSKKKH